MTDLSQILSSLIYELTPIHESEATFARGGRECARAIERIYRMLVEAESLASGLEAQVELLEEELRDQGEDSAGPAALQAEGSP